MACGGGANSAFLWSRCTAQARQLCAQQGASFARRRDESRLQNLFSPQEQLLAGRASLLNDLGKKAPGARGVSMKALGSAIAVMCLLSACTTTDEIIIDQKGVNMNAYDQDLAECRTYASEVKTNEKTAKGAGSGALVGGLIGAITGGVDGAARGAGVGAVGGGARGASEGERSEVEVVKRCLGGRGYRVLN